MHKFSLIVVAVCLFAGAVQAQEAQPQPATPDMLQGGVRHDPRPALAERLVQLTLRGMDKFTQETITGQLENADDAISEEQARWLRRHTPSIIESNLAPLVGAITEEYAARFTEAELNALIAFYEGPLGRDIARKQMETGGALGEAMQKFQVSFITELMTKFCGEFDCGAEAVKGRPASKPNSH
ncbi:hypothetical protein D3C80_1443750 [compost metagenome]